MESQLTNNKCPQVQQPNWNRLDLESVSTSDYKIFWFLSLAWLRKVLFFILRIKLKTAPPCPAKKAKNLLFWFTESNARNCVYFGCIILDTILKRLSCWVNFEKWTNKEYFFFFLTRHPKLPGFFSLYCFPLSITSSYTWDLHCTLQGQLSIFNASPGWLQSGLIAGSRVHQRDSSHHQNTDSWGWSPASRQTWSRGRATAQNWS